jgi:Acyl-CoA dehydrogenase, N-terminal domain
MQFTPEHEQLRTSLQKFIAAEINPHVDAWEKAGRFPAAAGDKVRNEVNVRLETAGPSKDSFNNN